MSKLKRSGFKRGAKRPPWRDPHKKHRPKPLVPKRLGTRAKPKNDHLRSEAHLKLVRVQPCLVTRSLVDIVAHHPKELFPAKMGEKISDYLCVPLRHDMHDPDHPGSVHKVNDVSWWQEKVRNPYLWLKTFLLRHYPLGDNPGVEHALSEIERYRGRYG